MALAMRASSAGLAQVQANWTTGREGSVEAVAWGERERGNANGSGKEEQYNFAEEVGEEKAEKPRRRGLVERKEGEGKTYSLGAPRWD